MTFVRSTSGRTALEKGTTMSLPSRDPSRFVWDSWMRDLTARKEDEEKERKNRLGREMHGSVSRNRKAPFLKGWTVKNHARRSAQEGGQVLRGCFGILPPLNCSPGSSILWTQNKRLLARSLFHSFGRSKKKRGGRPSATTETHNSLAVKEEEENEEGGCCL